MHRASITLDTLTEQEILRKLGDELFQDFLMCINVNYPFIDVLVCYKPPLAHHAAAYVHYHELLIQEGGRVPQNAFRTFLPLAQLYDLARQDFVWLIV